MAAPSPGAPSIVTTAASTLAAVHGLAAAPSTARAGVTSSPSSSAGAGAGTGARASVVGPIASADSLPVSPNPSSPHQSQPAGGGAAPLHQPRGRLVSRACDRCRRRKAKCEYLSAVDSCTHCRDAQAQCTFDLPLARRGPKARKRSDAATGGAADTVSGENGHRGAALIPPLPFPGPAAPSLQAFGPSSLSPETVWEPTDPPSIENGLPRLPLDEVLLPGLSSIQNISTRQRWLHLAQVITTRNTTLERIAKRCIDLFFDNLYPLTPLVYEPALRDVLAYIFSQPLPGMNQSSPHAQLTPDPTAGATPTSVHESWNSFGQPYGSRAGASRLAPWADSTFTLVTAVCAEAAFMLPKEVFPEGESVAEIFLQASRDCLHQHLEADLDSPNANSIAIRYFHSNCLHANGKPKYSWHIFGEAVRLAQVMHIHNESSLDGLIPIEAEFRRRCFWILYLGDKSAAILNNRPITIHRYCFESGITTLYPSGIEDEASLVTSPGDAPSDVPRKSFIAGFNANVRLWQSAADLLLEIRLLQDQTLQHFRGNIPPDHVLPPGDRLHLDSLFVRFITCLDNLPLYLQSCSHAAAMASSLNATTESKQYVIQCVNLQVTFQCLRMVITQKFEDLAYFAPGIEQADLRKSEIARDMLRVMQDAPFWALKANGEPNVEKIRLIGASLLAIIHRNEDSPLVTRARGDFTVLLDILTRLDSKASDALRSTSNSGA